MIYNSAGRNCLFVAWSKKWLLSVFRAYSDRFTYPTMPVSKSITARTAFSVRCAVTTDAGHASSRRQKTSARVAVKKGKDLKSPNKRSKIRDYHPIFGTKTRWLYQNLTLLAQIFLRTTHDAIRNKLSFAGILVGCGLDKRFV